MPRSSKIVTCFNCNTNFSKSLKEIRRSPNNFCSRSCSALYHNKNKTTIVKRSKFEEKMARILSEYYKNIKIEYNDRKTLGIELDVHIPEFFLAFEFNGRVHFDPIYGQDALKKIQQTDQRKKELCKEKNIDLYVIDIRNMFPFRFYKLKKHFDNISILIESQIKKSQKNR